jgi:hypothetical protein
VYDSTGARSGKRPGELAREFVFRSVCAFYTASFPGASLLAIEPQFEDGKPDFGWLIEYTDSEAARAWQLHFASSKRIIKHYQIAFLSENQLCVVFAGDVTLSNEMDTNQLTNT